MLEKRLIAVPPQFFTVSGTQSGMLTIANATLFKVKQEILLNAIGLPTLELEVKRITSINNLLVGPRNSRITETIDVSVYTTALNASISAPEQKRPMIPFEEHTRAVYEEEPTVALRTILVDPLGDRHSTDNPLPVDAQVTANVDLGLPSVPTIANISVPLANQEVSYAMPVDTQKIIVRVRGGGASMKLAFNAGDSGFIFFTVQRGSYLKIDGIKAPNLIAYFQTNAPNQVVEFMTWS